MSGYDQIRYDGKQNQLDFKRGVFAAAGITMVADGKYLVPNPSGKHLVEHVHGWLRCDCPASEIRCEHVKLVRKISDYVANEFFCTPDAHQQARDAAENEQVVACFNREPATDDNPEGGHNLRRLRHEEFECVDCGCIFFEPDF